MPKTKKPNPQAQSLARLAVAKRHKNLPKDYYKKLAEKRWKKYRIAHGADATDAEPSKTKPLKTGDIA